MLSAILIGKRKRLIWAQGNYRFRVFFSKAHRNSFFNNGKGSKFPQIAKQSASDAVQEKQANKFFKDISNISSPVSNNNNKQLIQKFKKLPKIYNKANKDSVKEQNS